MSLFIALMMGTILSIIGSIIAKKKRNRTKNVMNSMDASSSETSSPVLPSSTKNTVDDFISRIISEAYECVNNEYFYVLTKHVADLYELSNAEEIKAVRFSEYSDKDIYKYIKGKVLGVPKKISSQYRDDYTKALYRKTIELSLRNASSEVLEAFEHAVHLLTKKYLIEENIGTAYVLIDMAMNNRSRVKNDDHWIMRDLNKQTINNFAILYYSAMKEGCKNEKDPIKKLCLTHYWHSHVLLCETINENELEGLIDNAAIDNDDLNKLRNKRYRLWLEYAVYLNLLSEYVCNSWKTKTLTETEIYKIKETCNRLLDEIEPLNIFNKQDLIKNNNPSVLVYGYAYLEPYQLKEAYPKMLEAAKNLYL